MIKSDRWIKFLESLNKKVQIRIIVFFIILGTICFIMGTGPAPVKVSKLHFFFVYSLWRILGIFSILFLFCFPILGAYRESVLAEKIYQEKIGDQKLEFKLICEIFNLDPDVMKRSHGQYLNKKKVIKMIKAYFIK